MNKNGNRQNENDRLTNSNSSQKQKQNRRPVEKGKKKKTEGARVGQKPKMDKLTKQKTNETKRKTQNGRT